MSGLKSLAVCYLGAASVFVMAGALSAHRTAITALSRQVQGTIAARLDDLVRAESVSDPVRRIDLAPPPETRMPSPAMEAPPALPVPQIDAASLAFLIAPDLHDFSAELPVRDDAALRGLAAQARLQERLTPDLLRNFSLFLYVSTAPKGPLAQRLYIFRKDEMGGLTLIHDWAASTGRAQTEMSPQGRRAFTSTPSGYYELDPDRMYENHFSSAWNRPMPSAMFFNWEYRGAATGLAIHAATGDDIAKLGSRASAGCIHLSPAHAAELYKLIRTRYRGAAPRFSYDAASRTMNNRGELLRGADGKIKMADGYTVLTVIENFAGDTNMLAALDEKKQWD